MQPILYTSSVKSMSAMEAAEREFQLILDGNRVAYDTVLVDLEPEKKEDMMRVSGSKVIPQLHYGAQWWKIDDFRAINESEQVKEVLGASS